MFRRLALTAVVVTLLSWPVADLTPCSSVDCSWMYALHASLHGYHRGVPVTTFTYGPLGALSAPMLWFSSTAVLSVIALGLGQFLLILLSLHRAERVVHPLAAAILVLAMARTLTVLTAETAGITVVLIAVEIAERRPGRPLLLLLGGGAGVGFLLQIKASTGLLALASALVLGVALGGPQVRGRLRGAALAAASSAAWCFVFFAAVTGQPGAFIGWVRGSYGEVAGFDALALEPPGHGAEYVVAAVLVLVIGALAVRARRQPAIGVTVVLLALGIAVKAREGFVRHDGHVAVFLSAMIFIVLAVPLRRGLLDRISLLAVPATCLIALVSASVFTYSGLGNLTTGPRGAAKIAGQLADPRATQEAGRARIKADYDIPASLIQDMQGHRVEVDPFQTAAVFGYGLAWGPTRLFADYQSYTDYLDESNAASLGDESNRLILRPDVDVNIDNHFSPWDSPAYQLAILCSWHEIARAGNWQLLAPGTDRCGRTTFLSRVSLQPGETTIPPTPRFPGDIVVVRLTLTQSVEDKLAKIALKPLGPTYVTLNGQQRRLVTATADGSQMVRVPVGLPDGPGSTRAVNVSSLAVSGDVLQIDATFLEVSVHSCSSGCPSVTSP